MITGVFLNQFWVKKTFSSKNVCFLQNQPKTLLTTSKILLWSTSFSSNSNRPPFFSYNKCDQFWTEKFWPGSAYEWMSDKLHLLCFHIAYQKLFSFFFFFQKKDRHNATSRKLSNEDKLFHNLEKKLSSFFPLSSDKIQELI